MYFLLFYDTVDQFVEKRAPFRNLHLEFAQKAVKAGELLLGGALTDPADGAVLLFKGEDASVAERFAQNDPYVKNGLVTHWRVRTWKVVLGALAKTKT